MRIDSIAVHNFRGLRSAAADGLASSPMVTVSGPNGAGKSLLFEAMTFLWRTGMAMQWPIQVSQLVGPWDDKATIEVVFALAGDEQDLLTNYGKERGGVADGSAPDRIRLVVQVGPTGEYGEVNRVGDRWAECLWSIDFSVAHPFARLDYLPADRTIPRANRHK